MGHKSTVSEQEVQSQTTETGNGTSEKTFTSKSSDSIEAWIVVTALDTGDFTFNLEASLDETNFATVATEVNVTAVGTFPLSISRTNNPLGVISRVSWVKNSGTNMSFNIRMGRME